MEYNERIVFSQKYALSQDTKYKMLGTYDLANKISIKLVLLK